jgi:hypothetical protein
MDCIALATHTHTALQTHWARATNLGGLQRNSGSPVILAQATTERRDRSPH